jgi:hypothetical protein
MKATVLVVAVLATIVGCSTLRDAALPRTNGLETATAIPQTRPTPRSDLPSITPPVPATATATSVPPVNSTATATLPSIAIPQSAAVPSPTSTSIPGEITPVALPEIVPKGQVDWATLGTLLPTSIERGSEFI